MNYSKTIREYCLKNPEIVFDMSYEREKHFSKVPYKTFCKILSRIEAEGIIRTYSNGIYIINYISIIIALQKRKLKKISDEIKQNDDI